MKKSMIAELYKDVQGVVNTEEKTYKEGFEDGFLVGLAYVHGGISNFMSDFASDEEMESVQEMFK